MSDPVNHPDHYTKMYPFEVFNIMLNNGFVLSAVEPKGMKIKEIDSLKDL